MSKESGGGVGEDGRTIAGGRETQEETAKEKTGSHGANTQGNSEASKWVV